MSRNNGYVMDIEYIPNFCALQSPVHLSFACILNGVEPVPLDKPFTYFELGFGQGLGMNVFAASNPHGRFFGSDFNPAQVATAREFAAEARLDNLTLLENSFAELAQGEVDLPQFDFITMHGVYTWVNAENRQHIVNFIRRYLKPGGIVYSGYNAMPGWTSELPLKRFLLEHGELYRGSSIAQFTQARDFADALIGSGAAYFKTDAGLQPYLDHSKMDNPHYLVHEYMHYGWEPLYFADVARAFAAAKLDFTGSAVLTFAFPQYYLTPEQRALLDTVPDPVWRETAQDYVLNTSFRNDIFVRGARRMPPARQRQWLEKVGIALKVVREYMDLKQIRPAIAHPTVPEESYIAVVDALAERPRTLAELAALPALQNDDSAVAEIAAFLIEWGQAAPFFSSYHDVDSAPAHRMGRVVAQHSRFDAKFAVLASPLLGSGVFPLQVPCLVYRVLSAGIEAEQVEAIVAQVWQMVVEEGHKIAYPEGAPVESEDERRAALAKLVRLTLQVRVPIWRQLKVL